MAHCGWTADPENFGVTGWQPVMVNKAGASMQVYSNGAKQLVIFFSTDTGGYCMFLNLNR